MGYAVAGRARRRGATVTLVSGPTALTPPPGCDVVAVETADEMNEAMRTRVTSADVVVMVAAVADYRPVEVAASKIKKKSEGLTIRVQRTPDILSGLASARGNRVLVGFAAETERVRENALDKLNRKGLDLIVANDVSAPGSGFDVETNAALLIDRDGNEEETGVIGKDELADRVLDRVVRMLAQRPARRRATTRRR